MLFRLGSFCVTLIGPTCCTISSVQIIQTSKLPIVAFGVIQLGNGLIIITKEILQRTRSIVVLWLLSNTECPVPECAEQAKATVRHLLFRFVRRSNSIFIELCAELIGTGKDLTDEKVPLLGKRCVQNVLQQKILTLYEVGLKQLAYFPK